MAVPIAEGLVEEKFPPRKETTFLEEVEHVAVAAENMLWGIRSQYFPYGTPSLDELLCPDHLQGLIISQAQMADLLRQYITAVPLHQKIPVAHHRSSDIVIESANVWSGDPVAWEREVRTSIRKHLDALVHAFEKEAAQKAQTLEEELERTASRLYHLAYEAYGSSEQKAPPTIRFGGLLTGRIKELQNELQAAAKLRYPDDFKLLYELSFKAVVEAKGWDKLNDEQLAEALERKQVPLLIFEGYTGREITPPKKKPETVAEVIAEVKRKAEHYSRGGSSDLRSIDGQIILMPKKSTYVLGTQALREACAKEPNSPHPVFTRADGTQIYRSLTFHEDLLARVTDFNTEHDASGAQRSLADRLRLFDHWLDSCTGTAYEAGTDMMKIIPACEPLIIIPGDFSGHFLNVRYASLEGPEIDRSKHPHSTWLEKRQVIDDPYWLAAVEADNAAEDNKPLLREYANIVYAQLLEKYNRTMGMGFFPRSRTATDELRALFVRSLGNYSSAGGGGVLSCGGSFLRVAPSSDAPVGRRA